MSWTDALATAALAAIEIKVSSICCARAGSGPIEARGRTLRAGGRVAFAQARASSSDGELVGHATSSLAILRRS